MRVTVLKSLHVAVAFLHMLSFFGIGNWLLNEMGRLGDRLVVSFAVFDTPRL